MTTKKCIKCKKEINSSGFPKYNERFECDCGMVFIPRFSEKFGTGLLGVWVTKEQFRPREVVQ